MLIETIRKDMQNAKKNRETLKANLLSTLYGEMFTQSKSGKEFTAEDELKIIRKFIKNADETLKLNISLEAGAKLNEEKKILEVYLPSQLSDDEIDDIVKKMISEGKTIKEIMPFFKENYSGRYDGRKVSESVKNSNG